jgi:hypothetical protein
MNHDRLPLDPDPDRRVLLATTSAAGGVGLAATAVPFVASMVEDARSTRRDGLAQPFIVALSASEQVPR